MNLSRLLILICVGMTSGCAPQVKDFAVEPHLTPVGSGLRQPDMNVPVHYPVSRSRGGGASSTWRDDGADLFRDARAMKIGDVVTVKISIKDRASLDNSTNRKREATRDGSLQFGYDVAVRGLEAKGEGNLNASAKGNTETKGAGAISRSESIDLVVAAVVTGVLPNGNLLISGQQEVRVNFEVRELKVAGIVRARDISTDNSISYEKIAEIRMSYGGRGRVTEVQQPGWGQQLVDIIAPF